MLSVVKTVAELQHQMSAFMLKYERDRAEDQLAAARNKSDMAALQSETATLRTEVDVLKREKEDQRILLLNYELSSRLEQSTHRFPDFVLD
jgi:ABC-type phosphate transport system auxiliary subunit